MAVKKSTTSTRPAVRTSSYGDGCRAGHARAHDWLANPKICNPGSGGTLQHVILDLAKRFKDAKSQSDVDGIRGEIVGFCYAPECPADAVACLEADARRDAARRAA
jgi:hypothetical protein